MKTYLTNKVDVAYVCTICGANYAVQYSWPKPVIIDDQEIQAIACHHHKERSPDCHGTPGFIATKDGDPLQEYHMTMLQRIMMGAWVLFPFAVAAAIGLAFWMIRK